MYSESLKPVPDSSLINRSYILYPQNAIITIRKRKSKMAKTLYLFLALAVCVAMATASGAEDEDGHVFPEGKRIF